MHSKKKKLASETVQVEQIKNASHQINQMPWISMKDFLVVLEWVQDLD